ncbi:MAG: NAD(P)/FAD-dependent oxidoreductase [Flavobacteriales bacterium]|nr:NAD(P)/FAD-dependent oxidoreductase [Flavobacteriales bacterium]
MDVVVVGGGAAGFFAALSAHAHHPQAGITLLEKTADTLAKVRVSGGGRCNVTHACPHPRRFASHYPRGQAFLRKSFERFGQPETVRWFRERGVELKTEADGRMFPVTDDSGTIVGLLREHAALAQVRVLLRSAVVGVEKRGAGFTVRSSNDGVHHADKLIVTTGGLAKPEAYNWITALGHSIVPPVPSLFTFNMPGEPIRELMGVSVEVAQVRIIGTDLESTGPLLVTHWGMSGPAILRLSAWGARVVHDMGYRFAIRVNWLGGASEHDVRKGMQERALELARKRSGNVSMPGIPRRLWSHLLEKAGIDPARPWGELPRKERDRLIDTLTNDRYTVQGKTTFKEEFVTAGGVPLDEVDPLTMESRMAPGLFFAGEVLDVDGITGGFNFQAAWTTGYLAGRLGAAQ